MEDGNLLPSAIWTFGFARFYSECVNLNLTRHVASVSLAVAAKVPIFRKE